MERSFDYVKINLASPKRISTWGERILPNGQVVGEISQHDATERTPKIKAQCLAKVCRDTQKRAK